MFSFSGSVAESDQQIQSIKNATSKELNNALNKTKVTLVELQEKYAVQTVTKNVFRVVAIIIIIIFFLMFIINDLITFVPKIYKKLKQLRLKNTVDYQIFLKSIKAKADLKRQMNNKVKSSEDFEMILKHLNIIKKKAKVKQINMEQMIETDLDS